MWLDTTRRERFWRGLALALLIILLWQTGNSALKPVNPLVVGIIQSPSSMPLALHYPRGLPGDVIDPEVQEASESDMRPPTAAPPSAPTPPLPPPAFLRIANTGGIGAYLRATPRMTDRLRAWPDGTPMAPTGREADGEGHQWREVRAPDGIVGWMPATFLAP